MWRPAEQVVHIQAVEAPAHILAGAEAADRNLVEVAVHVKAVVVVAVTARLVRRDCAFLAAAPAGERLDGPCTHRIAAEVRIHSHGVGKDLLAPGLER